MESHAGTKFATACLAFCISEIVLSRLTIEVKELVRIGILEVRTSHLIFYVSRSALYVI